MHIAPRISDQISDPDQNPIKGSLGNQARARSNGGAGFVELMQIFTSRWERSYRRPYPPTAADRNQLSRFMRTRGEYIATFAAIVDRYLADRRQFIIDRSTGHTMKWLLTSGLALYGGQPRESAEQYAARIRREHEERKQRNRALAPQNPEMRDLIAGLADKKVAGY